jgi:uncharacterized protein YjlB
MSTTIPDAFTEVLRTPEVQARRFADDGPFPNNQALPVLVLQGAVQKNGDGLARTFERMFRAHGWRGPWRDGIFSYHHYHSTAHEVLGVAAGTARVQLGGPEGEAFGIEAGDVLVLPAGVAHKNLGANRDFLVAGAYPDGQDWDLKRGRPGERPAADRNIEQVPLPARDPVYGDEGPLVEHWALAP